MQKVFMFFTLAIACGTGTAFGQSPKDSDVVLSFNAGIRMLSQTRTDTFTFHKFAEFGQFAGTQTIGPYPVIDVGYKRRLSDRFGVGVSGSYVQGAGLAKIEATVPHPFFFDFPRSAIATSTPLTHRELGLHTSGQLLMSLPLNGLFTLSVGPTIFFVSQDYVSGLSLEELGAPFDHVNIASMTTVSQSFTAIGYHVGFDFSFNVTSRYGVGILVRYGKSSHGIRVDRKQQPALDMGRLQILGGSRIGF